MITVKVAGIPVGIDNKFRHIEWLAKDYVTDEEPYFTVSAAPDELVREQSFTEERFSDGYLESTVVYRKIAERLGEYDAFVFHGAVLAVDGLAYAFTARSGVGKTTHTRLWIEHFGERAYYVNGDKPIIRFIDGKPYAFGTPWRGKESYGTNTSAPLAGIAFVERGEKNMAEPADPDIYSTKLLSQMYIPRTGAAAAKVLSMCSKLLDTVKLVRLECNMDPDAPIPPAREFGIEI